MPKERNDPETGRIFFTARMRADLHTRFISHFPQQGANVWWLNTMMERFLAEVEKHPSTEELMQRALEQYMQDATLLRNAS